MIHPDHRSCRRAKRVAVLLFATALGALGCGARSTLLDDAPPMAAQGGPTCAAPAKTWSQQLGGPRAQIATDLAVDYLGYPVIVGAFRGELDVNGEALKSPVPISDIDAFSDNFALSGNFFVARLAPDGCGAMAKSFGPMIAGYEARVALDADGAVILAATFDGKIDFGGGQRASTDGGFTRGAVIAKYDASGAHRWSKMFHATSSLSIARPVTDAAGNVIIAGSFDREAEYDGASLGTIPPDQVGAFLAMIAPDGALRWSRILETVNHVGGLAPGISGLTVAPWPPGGATLSGETNTDALFADDTSFNGAFLASFDGAGQKLGQRKVLTALRDLAVAPSGDLLGLVWEPSQWKLVRAPLDGSNLVKTKLPGIDQIDDELRLAADPEGDLLLAGRRFDIDQPWPLVMAVKLSPALDVTWSAVFTNPPGGGANYRAMVVPGLSPNGDALLAGSFGGAIDFGQGPFLTPDASSDIFIAEVTP